MEETPELVDVGTTENLNCVYMHSDTQIWIVGDKGLIFYIYNDGVSLDITQQTSNTSENLTSVRYDLSGCGWISGDNGTVLRTTDLGVTWFLQSTITTEPLNDMSYVECNNAWAVGPNGLIIHTILNLILFHNLKHQILVSSYLHIISILTFMP